MEEDSSSRSTVESSSEYPAGTEIEIYRVPGSELALLLMKDQKSEILRTGEFTVKIIQQSHGPLSVVVCSVGDLLWTVSKDSPVLRLGFRRFSFFLPGFSYGLTLAENSMDEHLKKLEKILMRVCSYEDHSDSSSSSSIDGAEFWSLRASKIQKHSKQILRRLGIRTQKSIFSNPIYNSSQTPTYKPSLTAIRISAITKLVSRALLHGIINPNFHVNIVGESNFRSFATVQTFSDISDAVETAGRSLMAMEVGHVHSNKFRAWSFNKCGLSFLFRAMAASAFIHTTRNTGVMDSGSKVMKVEEGGSVHGCQGSESTGKSCLSDPNPVKTCETF